MVGLFEAGKVKKDALQLELYIKKQKSRRFIKRLIGENKFYGPLASLVRVPHMRD